MAYENWHIQIDYGTGFIDVTADVDTVKGPINAGIGDTAETSDQPGHMAITLNNLNHKYSPGNPLSTMALQTGLPIRLIETIGPFTFQLHNGTIEFPEITDLAFPVRDQQITVLSVDQLSRWERSQTFVSTLGAQIVYVGSTKLLGYWPCNDPSGSTQIGSIGVAGPLSVSRTGAAPASLLALSQVAGPAGEDTSFLTLSPSSLGGAVTLTGTTSTFVNFASFAEVTVAFWMRGTGAVSSTLIVRNDALTTSVTFTATTTQWQVAVVTPGGSTTVVSTAVATPDRWQMASVRINNTTGAVDLYVDAIYVSGTLGAGTATGAFDTTILQATGATTAYGHVQVYGGAAGTWSQTIHAAQYQMGLAGLERQTTGARVRTIATYAGLALGQLAGIDDGCSVMSRALLSGKTIADAMYECRDTERGRLFIAGDGTLTFHDRRTVLNV
jgi:hypothetical protein